MTNLLTGGAAVSPEIEAAIRRLASGAVRPEGTYVTLPVLYPSGSNVVVRVTEQKSENRTRFFVTDFGLGFQEAELTGVERGFARIARAVADRSGVGFDEHAFFAIQVDLDRLPGAIATIASCSVEAVTTAIVRVNERAATGMVRILIERLEEIFGAARVKKDEILSGDSGHDWNVPAFVQIDNARAIFDVATRSPLSITTVAAKMDDISRLKSAPRRFVMVKSTEELGTYLGVLSHHASVIEPNANENRLVKLVTAA